MKRFPVLAAALAVAAALSLALPAGAAEPADSPDLPPLPEVVAILLGNPAVKAASATLEAEEARGRRLAAGPHEWTVRLASPRRTVRANPEVSYQEWDVGVERSLRLPGKSELDRQLGAAGVATAEVSRGDALHEAGRALLAGWFDWQREQAQAEQWARQNEVLARQATALQRRTQLGDASRREALQADAALAQAQAQLGQAQARAEVAGEQLRRLYPGLTLPARVPETAPAAPDKDAAYWREAILEHNHELGVARAESARARINASRVVAEEHPDPSIGVHMGSERGGEERLVGVILNIPLGGAGRRADSGAAAADAQAASFREAAVERRVTAEAATEFRRASAAHAGWRAQNAAADALTHSAELTERAWQLGEGSLSDTLAARRLAHEAQLAARLARLDAAEAGYRLLLDAHQLWPLDIGDDDEHEHHHH